MLLNNFILESFLVYALLVLQQTEGKVGHKSKTKFHKKTIHKSFPTIASQNRLHGLKSKKAESGDRREYLSSNNALLEQPISSSHQTVSSLNPAIRSDDNNALNNEQPITTGTQTQPAAIHLKQLSNDSSQIQEDSLPTQNLPSIEKILSNGLENDDRLLSTQHYIKETSTNPTLNHFSNDNSLIQTDVNLPKQNVPLVGNVFPSGSVSDGKVSPNPQYITGPSSQPTIALNQLSNSTNQMQEDINLPKQNLPVVENSLPIDNGALLNQQTVPSTQPTISLNQLSNDANQAQEDVLPKQNLPFLDKKFLPHGIELERPLPIPYKKPAIRLVPKLIPFAYAKKPDVHVSHVHYEQGVNPCQNGGLHVQSPGGYSCTCRKQFKGNHCQQKDQCFPNPCKNGGNCIDHVTHYQCRCRHGFRGLKCEALSSCDKNPCKNGATCLDLVSGLRCVCAVGYKGRLCTDMDFCNPNPCKNGAQCTGKPLTAVCTCTNEYKGTRCEVKKVCLPNPCRNNGKCLEDKSSSPCECAQGFTGTFCTEHVCKPNPCLNGGLCTFKKSTVSSNWLPLCKCAVTFKGEKCEIPNPCAGTPSPCKQGVCFDAFNGRRMDLLADHYVCNCHRGYMGPKCDVRICDKCDKNAKCLNKECVCNDGYVGNGRACKKLPDPCIPNPCKNFGKCVTFQSSYDCRCPFSFVGSRCEQQL